VLTIVAAIEPELAGVRRRLRTQESLPVDVRAIGIGRQGLAASVGRLLDSHRGGGEAGLLLLLGFTGGLDPALKAGDLLVPTRYYHESGESVAADGPMWYQARVAAAEAGLCVVQGNSLTVERPAATPQAKRQLYRQHQVGSVNMEDYWVAEAAARAKVPFLAVRAVLDPVSQALPGYVLDLAGRPANVAFKVAFRPWRWPTLWNLAHLRSAAQASLTRFALSFINHQMTADRRYSPELADPACGP